jgi:TonB family protein
MEAVTAVLVERARAARGLPRMLTASAAAHATLILAVVLAPALLGRRASEAVRPVMTVSLGGAPGPRAGGMTLMGRPATRQPAALMESRRPAPVASEAARRPAMVLPTPGAKPAPPRSTAPPAPEPVEVPTHREQQPFGATATAADNPARGMGFGGLSTGGSGGTGGYLEISDFCCPDYLETVLQLVQRNWNPRQGINGETLLKFQIERDGRITEIELERSSGYAPLDLTAQRALFMTQRVQPLPAAFSDRRLTIHLRFQYAR